MLHHVVVQATVLSQLSWSQTHRPLKARFPLQYSPSSSSPKSWYHRRLLNPDIPQPPPGSAASQKTSSAKRLRYIRRKETIYLAPIDSSHLHLLHQISLLYSVLSPSKLREWRNMHSKIPPSTHLQPPFIVLTKQNIVMIRFYCFSPSIPILTTAIGSGAELCVAL